MSAPSRKSRQAFTLIELLVVVAIIALLISILLPSLSAAREQARAAACGAMMKGFGTGLHGYASEFNDYFPGVNTSGVLTFAAAGSVDALRNPDTPVQNYDWLTPILKYDTHMEGTRAGRFKTIINDYRCPSMAGLTVDELYGVSGLPDRQDFLDEVANGNFAPLSYLMPVHFQWWGRATRDEVLATITTASGRTETLRPMVHNASWEAAHAGRYRSRIADTGVPARKVMVADGMRYYDIAGGQHVIDFDVSPNPGLFGSFTTSGGWWSGSTAYGVRNGSPTWGNHGAGAGSPARGNNLAWTYRHGISNSSAAPTDARSNRGSVNAMFFDGHVARLNDRASREISLWYPAGTKVNNSSLNEGMTTVEPDHEVY